MPDKVSPEKRSQMMAGIPSKNTKPELAVRLALHKLGYRYRLHNKKLPGKPDIVFPQYKAVLFVNGCFWHGHDCHLFKWPSTREEFWQKKISGNQKVDDRSTEELLKLGWRVGHVWECAIKGKAKLSLEELIEKCVLWLNSNESSLNIKGYL